MQPADSILFKPGGYQSSPGFVLTGGVVLTVFGLAAALSSPWALLVAVIGIWYLSSLRQRALLTRRELIVQGRLTRRTVSLSDVEQVHEESSRTVWLAARGQDPFRVYFVRGGDPGPDTPGGRLFVTEVRKRAAALGAPVDVDAELVLRAPRGTSLLFAL